MTAESWRVAQILVDRGPGDKGSRGSGYLVAPSLVLTAAHVVAGARVVRARLDVGQRTEVDVQAEGWWADPEGSNGTDLAVLMIAADATEGRHVEPARFGRISDGTAVLAVQAFGFPCFKLRSSPEAQGGPGVFRDLEQVTGHAPVAANRRQGTLAVYLDDPAPALPEPGVSRRGRACPGPPSGPLTGSSPWWPSITPAKARAGLPLGGSIRPTTSCQSPMSVGSCTGWGCRRRSADCVMSSRPDRVSSSGRPTWNRSVTSPPTR